MTGFDKFSLAVAGLIVAVWAAFQVLRLIDPTRPDLSASLTVPMGLACGFLFGRPIVKKFIKANGENGG